MRLLPYGPRVEHYKDEFYEERLFRLLALPHRDPYDCDPLLALVLIAHREHGKRWQLRVETWDG
jgi:hypothetical protein